MVTENSNSVKLKFPNKYIYGTQGQENPTKDMNPPSYNARRTFVPCLLFR